MPPPTCLPCPDGYVLLLTGPLSPWMFLISSHRPRRSLSRPSAVVAGDGQGSHGAGQAPGIPVAGPGTPSARSRLGKPCLSPRTPLPSSVPSLGTTPAPPRCGTLFPNPCRSHLVSRSFRSHRSSPSKPVTLPSCEASKPPSFLFFRGALLLA